jgi:hypothetical protein
MRSNDALHFLQRTPQANTAMVARYLGCREDTAIAILTLLQNEGKVRGTNLRSKYGFWRAMSRPENSLDTNTQA